MNKKILRHIAFAGLLFAQATTVNAAGERPALNCKLICMKGSVACAIYLGAYCSKWLEATVDDEKVKTYCDERPEQLKCVNDCVTHPTYWIHAMCTKDWK